MKKLVLISATCVLFLFQYAYGVRSNHGQSLSSEIKAKPASPELGFTENKGQVTDLRGVPVPYVYYTVAGLDGNMYITDKGLTFMFIKEGQQNEESIFTNPKHVINELDSIKWCRLDILLEGAIIQKGNIVAEDPKKNVTNYYLPHCANGILNVMSYSKITIKEIYKGIDWVLYLDDNGLKYDFVVKQGGSPDNIRISYPGAKSVRKETDTKVIIESVYGSVIEGDLKCFEKESGKGVKASYNVTDNKVSFNISGNSLNKVLVIDPPLAWGTYFGQVQNTDQRYDLVIDASNNLYLIGSTNATALFFPLYDPSGSSDYYDGSLGSVSDVFISKFNSGGAQLWTTYFGGSSLDYGFGITLDPSGNIFITGQTKSSDFPVQSLNGAYNDLTLNTSQGDAFFAKFNTSLSLIWCTYYGGSTGLTPSSVGFDIASDSTGNIYATGHTYASDFPVNNNVGGYFDNTHNSSADAFLVRFTASTLMNDWSTFLGGNGGDVGYGLTLDNDNKLYLCGQTNSTPATFPDQNFTGAYYDNTLNGNSDAFIASFTSTLGLEWATYYGGSGDETAFGITDNGFNNSSTYYGIVITGYTTSSDFSTYNPGMGTYYDNSLGGSVDAFILKFNSSCARNWATYYGGSTDEKAYAIANDGVNGNIFITGFTNSTDLPVKNNGGNFYQGTLIGGNDIFIAKFNHTGLREWSSYYGGSSNDFGEGIACTSGGRTFITGLTSSTNFNTYTKSGAYMDLSNNTISCYIVEFSCTPSVPSVNAGSDVSRTQSCCLPQTGVTIGTSGSLIYEWTPSTGLSCTTCAQPVATPGSTTTYTVVGTSSCGINSDAVTVTVNQSTACCGAKLADITDSEAPDRVFIYPNPNNGIFNIVIIDSEQEVDISVEDLVGKVIFKQSGKLPSGALEIDISDRPKGIYFIRVSEDAKMQVLKIVNQ